VEEVKGDHPNDIEDFTVKDVDQDDSAALPQKLLMSGRRPAKSVDRTAAARGGIP